MASFFNLLLSEEELEVIDLFAKVCNLIHVAVESGSLLELRPHLIIREMSVSAFSNMDLISDSLVITVLALEIVKLLSQFSNKSVFL